MDGDGRTDGRTDDGIPHSEGIVLRHAGASPALRLRRLSAAPHASRSHHLLLPPPLLFAAERPLGKIISYTAPLYRLPPL